MLQPFLDVLASRADLPAALTGADVTDPDQRLPIQTAHRLLDATVELTGDANLGLKAARRFRLGDAGTIDYLVSSVETIHEALKVAARYMRLINDALDVEIVVQDRVARIWLHNGIAMPRAAVDFQAGAVFRTHLRPWLQGALPNFQVALPYAAPSDTSEHELTFAPARLVFDAPRSGFVFDRRLLEAPLEKADPRLHTVLRAHAERSLTELPMAQTVTQKVRDAVTAELGSGGNPTAPHIAKRMGMSTSTLGRRLDDENTTFKELTEQLRKQLAMNYLANRELGLSEVALLLGFSQSSAFHRAFRRWTGQTPIDYRRQWCGARAAGPDER